MMGLLSRVFGRFIWGHKTTAEHSTTVCKIYNTSRSETDKITPENTVITHAAKLFTHLISCIGFSTI